MPGSGQGSNPGSGERQRAVSGGALDHTAVRAGPSLHVIAFNFAMRSPLISRQNPSSANMSFLSFWVIIKVLKLSRPAKAFMLSQPINACKPIIDLQQSEFTTSCLLTNRVWILVPHLRYYSVGKMPDKSFFFICQRWWQQLCVLLQHLVQCGAKDECLLPLELKAVPALLQHHWWSACSILYHKVLTWLLTPVPSDTLVASTLLRRGLPWRSCGLKEGRDGVLRRFQQLRSCRTWDREEITILSRIVPRVLSVAERP